MTGLWPWRRSPRKEVSVSAAASREPASRLGLHLGDRIAVQDLLYGLLLKSANDASVALAETAAGDVDRFVKLMNEKARTRRAEDGLQEPERLAGPGAGDDGLRSCAHLPGGAEERGVREDRRDEAPAGDGRFGGLRASPDHGPES